MAFIDRMQDFFGKSLDASKDFLGKAKDKAKDLTEMGVLKVEILQLEKMAAKTIGILGAQVYKLLVDEDHASVTKKNAEIKDLLDEIESAKNKIIQKEEALKSYKETENK
ncbi:MAG: hypothetical protein E4H36_13995 [Spirochaetales bacterium]|nr:MAG: hypothetical protein E4H36_13995 [Spirochaetales bacterium]